MGGLRITEKRERGDRGGRGGEVPGINTCGLLEVTTGSVDSSSRSFVSNKAPECPFFQGCVL